MYGQSLSNRFRAVMQSTQVAMPQRYHVGPGLMITTSKCRTHFTAATCIIRQSYSHVTRIKSMSNDEKSQAGFSREPRPPNEDVKNAAKEMEKEQSLAGPHSADPNPMGGAGLEPPQADGEGQGYSMTEVAERGEDDEKERGRMDESEEAGVQDVE